MGLIKHNLLEGQLEGLASAQGPNAFLICGEPYLVRRAFDALIDSLLGDQPKEFSLERLDGNIAPVGDIVEQTSTFSFLQSKKVIAVKDAPLFLARAAAGQIAYSASDMDVLAELIEKRIPDIHTLVMTSGPPDRRKKIYKLFNRLGMIIDCTVAQGVRKADMDEQQAVLKGLARHLLSGTGKQMDSPVFNALVNQTGFNPEVFARNIEKLLAYTATRPSITVQDVMAVVQRDKKDPIFSLTNAVMERDAATALNLLSSLLNEGFHPLQMLKTLENQIRKLLNIKCFVDNIYASRSGIPPLKAMHFNRFKQVMLPEIVARDQEIIAADGANADAHKAGGGKDTPKTKKKKRAANDLLLAPNPKSSYPVFQNFQKSENFSLYELARALKKLADLDYGVKSSGLDAKTGIENFIMVVCRKGDM